jgi:hypothetical protein
MNFAKQPFKTCGRQLPLLPILSKKISKAVSNGKMKVWNRILATSARSEQVGKELN